MKGSYVKKILKEDSYSFDEIASRMGVSPQNLQSKLKSSDIKVGVLESIAKAINKNVYYFFEGKKESIDLVEENDLVYGISTEFSETPKTNEGISEITRFLHKNNEILVKNQAYRSYIISASNLIKIEEKETVLAEKQLEYQDLKNRAKRELEKLLKDIKPKIT